MEVEKTGVTDLLTLHFGDNGVCGLFNQSSTLYKKCAARQAAMTHCSHPSILGFINVAVTLS